VRQIGVGGGLRHFRQIKRWVQRRIAVGEFPALDSPFTVYQPQSFSAAEHAQSNTLVCLVRGSVIAYPCSDGGFAGGQINGCGGMQQGKVIGRRGDHAHHDLDGGHPR
jgi:hypothetical protein